jgi:hypothetical protein
VIGGHISREIGITVNGCIPVEKVITMYAHNAPGQSFKESDETDIKYGTVSYQVLILLS